MLKKLYKDFLNQILILKSSLETTYSLQLKQLLEPEF